MTPVHTILLTVFAVCVILWSGTDVGQPDTKFEYRALRSPGYDASAGICSSPGDAGGGCRMAAKRKQPKIVDGEELWQCNKCKEWKNVSEYHKRSASPNGLSYRCKSCANEALRQNRHNNRDRWLSNARRYYYTNHDKSLEYDRRWKRNNKDRINARRRELYQENADKKREESRQWAEDNKEKRSAGWQSWYKANRDRIYEYQKENYDPVKAHARSEVRKAVRTGRLIKPDVCESCGAHVSNKRFMHAHHHDYSKPLDVEWLCTKCHGITQRKENADE